MRPLTRHIVVACALAGLAGCASEPFKAGSPSGTTPPPSSPGRGPTIPEVTGPATTEPDIQALPPAPLPKERPKVAPATLSPASKALVSQAQTQRKKGDLPGAAASLDRALRIEPRNPLLWIEMGRLRMDQRNYPQAEAMGRKALSMSIGDGKTQSSAWVLIAESLRARGRNPEAQEALQKSRELSET
jgi:Flp pilus assembly protein TadD